MISELRDTIDHLRAEEKQSTQPVLCSGCTGKREPASASTLETSKQLVANDKSDHEINYSVSSDEAEDLSLD